jgi:hypothetical protein
MGAPALRSEHEQRFPSLLNDPCLMRPVLLTSQTSVSSGAQVSLAEASLGLRLLSDAQAVNRASISSVVTGNFIATGLFGLRDM